MSGQPASGQNNPQLANGKTGLQKFLDKVNDAFKDASELEVLTFSGEVKSYIVAKQTKEGFKGLDWEKFFTEATTEAKLNLVAATQVKIDGDTILFISSDPAVPDSLKQVHVNATMAAQKYRTELVLGLANILGIKLTSV